MRNQQLEKKIMKIDRDIEGLNIAKKYLSNPEEIEDVKVGLNRERQLMIFGLYEEDNKSKQECIEMLSELAGQEFRLYQSGMLYFTETKFQVRMMHPKDQYE